MIYTIRTALFLNLFFSSVAYADLRLDCQVERAPSMDKISRESVRDKLELDSIKIMEKYLLSQKFTVDLRTGMITGSIQNYTVNQSPVVIEFGVSNGFYKSLLNAPYINGNGARIVYFASNLTHKGVRKPFNIIDNYDVYMGSCEIIS